MGRPAPLQLDHINGQKADNRLENLRLLCANCHAQTDTYGGANVRRVPSPRAARAAA
jgi:5-methylcytosine-specific restriction endonuclease McrA